MSGTLIVGYGPPGTGKSLAGAAFAAEMFERTGKPVEVADYEQSAITYPVLDNPPWEVVEPEDTGHPIEACWRILDRRLERLKAGEISGAIDDTLSSLCNYFMEDIISQSFGGQRVVVKSGNLKLPTPTQQDYGLAVDTTTTWVRKNSEFIRAGGTLLWLTHEKELEVEVEGGISKPATIGPLFIGKKLTRELPKYPHVTLRFFTKKRTGKDTPDYMVQTCNDGLYFAKDRLRVLPAAPFAWTGSDDESILTAGRKIWAPILDRRGPHKKEN